MGQVPLAPPPPLAPELAPATPDVPAALAPAPELAPADAPPLPGVPPCAEPAEVPPPDTVPALLKGAPPFALPSPPCETPLPEVPTAGYAAAASGAALTSSRRLYRRRMNHSRELQMPSRRQIGW